MKTTTIYDLDEITIRGTFILTHRLIYPCNQLHKSCVTLRNEEQLIFFMDTQHKYLNKKSKPLITARLKKRKEAYLDLINKNGYVVVSSTGEYVSSMDTADFTIMRYFDPLVTIPVNYDDFKASCDYLFGTNDLLGNNETYVYHNNVAVKLIGVIESLQSTTLIKIQRDDKIELIPVNKITFKGEVNND